MRVFLLLMCLAGSLSAQSDLYLIYIMRDGEVPAERLRLGDYIAIHEAEAEWFKGTITAINDEYVQVNNRSFSIKHIDGIRTYNQLGTLGGQALWKGGLLFASIAIVNGIINSDEPLVQPVFLYYTGGAAILGGILHWMSRKTYRLENNWYFKVIDYKFEP